MAGASLLTLIDDISTILDDVALMTKVATKKTAGVLGDDLALNAQQVTGVRADRELPVVWAVAKGSLINKIILVPLALLISWIYPPLVTLLLMAGGIFLCFEGAEKVLHHLQHKSNATQNHTDPTTDSAIDLQTINPTDNSTTDPTTLEKQKIKGAIRTDFILSAEIIVIALGTMTDGTLLDKTLTLSLISVMMTLGVYGLVALIVKLDDLGLYLLQKPNTQKLGNAILWFAPALMKTLSIVGTLAMFMVGGGILVHGIDFLHHTLEHLAHMTGAFAQITQTLTNALIGLIVGLTSVALLHLIQKLKPKHKTP